MLSSAHPIEISLKRIDFSVVRNVSERLCKSPFRKRIGGKTGMHNSQSGNNTGVIQFGVVLPYLVRSELSFVNDG
jgi:hypothetical protein